MMEKKRNGYTVFILIVFLLVTFVAMFPIYSLFIASFKPGAELVRYGLNIKWDTSVMSLNNYSYLFSPESSYFTWFQNSVIITVLHCALCLLLSAFVGYALAMYKFKLNGALFILVLLSMAVPVEILMLPLYKMIAGMNLVNNYMGVILPFVIAPTCIFFFRQYLAGIPKDFQEAARIDGASEYGIYFRIYMPLMKPAFTAMLILQAMNSWNSLLWPMLVLRSSEMQTLSIGLKSLLTPYGNNYDMLISGSVMAVLPVLLLYIVFQRYFIEGMTAGGVKG